MRPCCRILAALVLAAGAAHAAACPVQVRVQCHPVPARPAAAAATIVLRLPADARVLFDGDPTTTTGPVRTFHTPALPAGKDYHYTVQAEVQRNGKTVTLSRRIAVRAAATTEVAFGDMTSAVTQSPDGFVIPEIEDLPEPRLPELRKPQPAE
jgi:uncharacterized protein (TIGR03000 family)